MAEVARRLPSQSSSSSSSSSNSRSYSHSPQKSIPHRSSSQSNNHSLPDHTKAASSSSKSKPRDSGKDRPSSSLPSSPSERKKLQNHILANGSSDQLQETLKQKGMLHALLSDPVKFVKSNDRQGQDYTSMQITPVNDPDFAATQQRKSEQKQHSLLLHADSHNINEPISNGTEAMSSSPTKSSKQRAASLDLYPYKISLRFPGKIRPSATGLSNYGNTCYMNSVMQSLIHTPPLAFALLTNDLSDLHGDWGGRPAANFDAVAAMQAFAKRSLQGTRSTNAPQDFNRNLKAFAKPLRQGRQEDAHEYLRFLLEAMQQCCLAQAPKSLKPDDAVRRSTFVQKIFGGKLRSRVTCHNCGHNSDTFDPFMDLSLDVRKGINSLSDAFRTFVAKDRLTGSEKYKCDKCKRKVDATKQFTIDSPPPALTIHLKRFTAFGGKISRAISFDESINISPYLSISKGHARYRLYAVVHHFGSGPNSGHYVASVRSPSGKWTKMDDSYVSDMPKSGPVNDSSAYILFYLREKDEALEKALLSPLGAPAKLSGFVKSGLSGLVNSSPFKSKKRKASMGSEAGDETLAASDLNSDASPAKAAKFLHLERSLPSPSALPAMSTSDPTSPVRKSGSGRRQHADSDNGIQLGDQDSTGDQLTNIAHNRLVNGSSQKLDHLLSSRPTSTANFYGTSPSISNSSQKKAAYPMSSRIDSEELGEAVERDAYESLVDSPRPPSSIKRALAQVSDLRDDDDSDDQDTSMLSSVSTHSLSKKERRRQKKASQSVHSAKAGRGVPSSPYASPFTTSPRDKNGKGKARRSSSSSFTGNLAKKMKPRPSPHQSHH